MDNAVPKGPPENVAEQVFLRAIDKEQVEPEPQRLDWSWRLDLFCRRRCTRCLGPRSVGAGVDDLSVDDNGSGCCCCVGGRGRSLLGDFGAPSLGLCDGCVENVRTGRAVRVEEEDAEGDEKLREEVEVESFQVRQAEYTTDGAC